MTKWDEPLQPYYGMVNAFLVSNIAAVLLTLLAVLIGYIIWLTRKRPGERAMATIEEEKSEKIAMGELLDDLLIEAVSRGKLNGDRALIWQSRLGNIFTMPMGGVPLKERLAPAVKVKRIVLKTV